MFTRWSLKQICSKRANPHDDEHICHRIKKKKTSVPTEAGVPFFYGAALSAVPRLLSDEWLRAITLSSSVPRDKNTGESAWGRGDGGLGVDLTGSIMDCGRLRCSICWTRCFMARLLLCLQWRLKKVEPLRVKAVSLMAVGSQRKFKVQLQSLSIRSAAQGCQKNLGELQLKYFP